MGWDVVQIGLRHNLPMDKPKETTRILSERMNRNVCLAYRKEYDFNGDTESLDWSEHFDIIEIEEFNINDSNDCIYLIIPGYQANLIKDSLGIDKIRELAKYNETAEDILYEIEEPESLFKIEDKEEKISIYIFKENVTLDVYVDERWFN